MGLNKPITCDGGLTAAEVQSIIDAQTTTITGKVDAQTNTLKNDLPSSISGGASISEIESALDAKLPQYSRGAVVKSKQIVKMPAKSISEFNALAKGHGFVAGVGSANVNGAYRTFVYVRNGVHTANNLQRLVNDVCGTVVLNSVDISHSLIYSSQNNFLDNRKYGEETINRKYNAVFVDGKNNTVTYNDYLCYRIEISVEEDSVMVLEFN